MISTLIKAPRRTLRWLRRFRHRRGYGIHSPFAFGFVTGVVYEAGAYYAYAPLAQKWRGMLNGCPLRPKDLRLLLRLANFQHPARCWCVGYAADGAEAAWLKAGSSGTHYTTHAGGKADMIVANQNWPACADALTDALAEGGMMVLTQVGGRQRRAWLKLLQHPKAQVAFDLYDFGIVFFRPELRRQHYVVNYL